MSNDNEANKLRSVMRDNQKSSEAYKYAAQAGIVAVLLSGAVDAASVKVEAREWRQLTDTVGVNEFGFTWNQLNTVCGIGPCAGSLGDVSFDGWIWATNVDLQALFDELILPSTIQFPTPVTDDYREVDSGAIDEAFALFNATRDESSAPPYAHRAIGGWSRTLASPATAFIPSLQDFNNELGYADWARLGQERGLDSPGLGLGVWLYRQVPEPATWALLGLGLAGLGLTRRRKAS